jgi:hypothetical protein
MYSTSWIFFNRLRSRIELSPRFIPIGPESRPKVRLPYLDSVWFPRQPGARWLGSWLGSALVRSARCSVRAAEEIGLTGPPADGERWYRSRRPSSYNAHI